MTTDYEKLYRAVMSNSTIKQAVQEKIDNVCIIPYCEHIECISIKDHNTPHLSKIMHEDEQLFKWRIYWTDNDWGSYIVDEAGQVFDFWKAEEEGHHKWVKENLRFENK